MSESQLRPGFVVEPGNRYCRSGNASRDALRTQVSQYAQCRQQPSPMAEVMPSGMNAICALLHSVLVLAAEEQGLPAPHFVFGDEMYGDLKRTISFFKITNRFTYDVVDVRDQAAITTIFKQRSRTLRLFFIESCTNPSGQMFDFKCWAALKVLAPKCLFAVDNTWLTCKLFNPLQYGADVILESMTKYLSASQCIGGMLAGNKAIMDKISLYVRVQGLFISPDQCQIYSDGLCTLEERMEAAGKVTQTVAEWLEAHKKVNRVMYPMLKSHPTYKTNCRQIRHSYGPAVLLFHINRKFRSRRVMTEFFESTGLVAETSYGSSYSKLDTWSAAGKHHQYERTATTDTEPKGLWVRMAVGYEATAEGDIACLTRLLGSE